MGTASTKRKYTPVYIYTQKKKCMDLVGTTLKRILESTVKCMLESTLIFNNEVIYKVENTHWNFYVENPAHAVYGGRSTSVI